MTRRAWPAAGVAAAVALAAAATAAVVGFGGEGDARDPGASPPATATIIQGNLTKSERVDGTLDYGESTLVTGRLAGMVTGLPALGATIGRGQPLYHVDAEPVALLHGARPLHRRLAIGVNGGDVRLLEENLSALGYQGFTVDDDFTGGTADAVCQWQRSLGLPETGTVEPGRVVVAPGPVRISASRARLGDAATGPVVEYTGTTRQVTVKLDVTKQDLAVAGAAAVVELPNGERVNGVVASVGSVASAVTVNNQTTVTILVVVTVAEQEKLGRYDEAPVDVELVAQRRDGVLSVPVAALLALSEGGYGLEIIENGGSRILPVRTGLFSGGRVEVSGDGLRAGMSVGVPS